MLTIVFLCLGIAVTRTTAYGSGAPRQACAELEPQHINITGQTTPSPYSLVVSNNTYRPGQPISVTITVADGTAGFQGFLIQARIQDTNESVGFFSEKPSFTRFLQCSRPQDSVTHSSTDLKYNLTMTWTAPDINVPIVVRGTVAENKTVYWAGLSSNTLEFQEEEENSGDKLHLPISLMSSLVATILFVISG